MLPIFITPRAGTETKRGFPMSSEGRQARSLFLPALFGPSHSCGQLRVLIPSSLFPCMGKTDLYYKTHISMLPQDMIINNLNPDGLVLDLKFWGFILDIEYMAYNCLCIHAFTHVWILISPLNTLVNLHGPQGASSLACLESPFPHSLSGCPPSSHTSHTLFGFSSAYISFRKCLSLQVVPCCLLSAPVSLSIL